MSNETDDNDNSSTDTDRLAAVLEEHITDESAEYDPEAPYGRVGTGKTARQAEAIAAVSAHDDTEPEWVDPKATREDEKNDR